MLKLLCVCGAVAISASLVVPTVTQAQEPRSVTVSYADLNLANDAGASILEKRIGNAARIVCEIEDSRQMPLAQATLLCRNQAVADARPQFMAAVTAARHPSVTVLPAAIAVTAR